MQGCCMPLPATIPLPGGLQLPTVGLGTFKLRGEEASRAVGCALQHGYRALDTASIYKNEGEVAAAVQASGVPRSDVFLTTKVSPHQAGWAGCCAPQPCACPSPQRHPRAIHLV